MNLREAIDLVIADTREGMGEPGMTPHEAINLAFEADMNDVTAVVEDPDVVEAYRTVFAAGRAGVGAALTPDQPAPAAEPDHDPSPTADAEDMVDHWRVVRTSSSALLSADRAIYGPDADDEPDVTTDLDRDEHAPAAGQQVSAAVRACDSALADLDQADTDRAGRDRAAELARRSAAEQSAQAGTGLDREI